MVQALAPAVETKLPFGQVVHVEDPVAGAKVPGGHFTQVVLRKAPTKSEYVPMGHGVHVPAPTVGAYAPLGQSVHVDVPLAAANLPAWHGVQLLDPAEGENVPGAQGWHLTMSLPNPVMLHSPMSSMVPYEGPIRAFTCIAQYLCGLMTCTLNAELSVYDVWSTL